MINLPHQLNKIEGLHHSIYADDVTLWVAGGSDGEIQEKLQQAIDVVVAYTTPKGLSCSPQKSDLLIYRPNSRDCKRVRDVANIQLHADGRPIAMVQSIRVLGLRIQANGCNTEAIKALETSVHQTVRLISGIANRHHGMKEGNLVRLVQAFVLSRIVYATPFLALKANARKKINNIIKLAYKPALGIPITAPNERIGSMGLHNTIDKLVEAQKIAQLERLRKHNRQAYPTRASNNLCESTRGKG